MDRLYIETKVANRGRNSTGRLSHEELNEMVQKINEVVDSYNSIEADVRKYQRFEFMNASDLEDLQASQAVEGMIYYGLTDYVPPVTTWRFGGKFPIRFT